MPTKLYKVLTPLEEKEEELKNTQDALEKSIKRLREKDEKIARLEMLLKEREYLL